MSAPPDFRLYSSNALDVLAALLAEELRVAPVGAGLLDPDTILIPQPSMRRWLQKTLAERHGIAANLRFLAPGQFVGEVLAANLPDAEDAVTIDPACLQWRLYAALRDAELLAQPAFDGALRGYLSGADAELNAWSLASGLGDAFTKYQAWRRDWLLRWDRGADADDWQALLWRHVTRGRRHRAQAIDAFLRQHSAAHAPPPGGLPPRVFAFACLNVSPDVLHVLATAARATTLHFYLPTPTRKYWGDLPDLRDGLAAGALEAADGGDNPLLAAWGRAGRDFIATLFSYDIVAPREIEAYAPPDPAQGLLQRLQRDILERRAAAPPTWPTAAIDSDRSLQIHACHTRLREVQVLHDQLRALFEDQPDLEPRDVAVMAPDIDAYAPYVAAVFGGAQGSNRFIPYTLADGSMSALSPLADLFLRLLELPQARLTSNEVLDLLALPGVRRRFELDDSELDQVRAWVAAAGARWGIDEHHRARLGAPSEHAYTWRYALDRLLLGYASGSDDDIAGVAPWPHLEGAALLALDALIRLLDQLERAARDLALAQSAEEWQRRLSSLLEDLLPEFALDAAERRALEHVLAELEAFRRAAAEAGVAHAIPAQVVRAHFHARLGEADTRQAFLAGGVSFCRMVPMRLIPFRVICLLGLNDGDYPRREPPSTLNRLVAALDQPAQRRRGDRSVRDDDRFLFLQLLTAAERVFYLSYIGRDAGDGSPREPSVLVSELLDAASRVFDDPAAARRRLVLQHPLQPFGRSGVDATRRVAFDPAWQAALTTRASVQTEVPFATHALPAIEPRSSIDYAELRAFLLNPQRSFLRNRLGLRLLGTEVRIAEDEPFTAVDALENSVLKHRVLAALIDAEPPDDVRLCRRLQAEALLPPAAAGMQRLRTLLGGLRPLARAIAAARSGEEHALAFTLDLDGVTLAGALESIDAAAAVRIKPGTPGGRDWLRWHLDALVLAALGEPREVAVFAEFGGGDLGPRVLPRHAAPAARAALRWLVDRLHDGLAAPLPFRPAAAWAFVEARARSSGTEIEADADAFDAAEKTWNGHEGHGEGSDLWTAIALRGADPFADAASRARFAEIALGIVGAVRDATPAAGAPS
ncbi:MAG TPA: exodeoxyribonuclease V subunit gamma [Dokdonella sp.]